jgi:AcrR family transcriptional regulator
MPKAPQTDKRAHILKVAGETFLEKGFAGASMSDIAKAGAGSKGTLYTYFVSKEELFEEFMATEISARASLTFDLPEQANDPVHVLKQLGCRYLELITDPIVSSLLRVVIAETVRFPRIGQLFNAAGPKAAKTKLAHFFGKCVANGSLVIDDVPMAVEQYMMLCQAGIMQDFLFGVRTAPTKEDIDRTTDAAVATFMATYSVTRCI